MKIRGDHLGSKLRAEVLGAYIYRWTTGNERRQEVYSGIGAPSLPPVSDDEWLRTHYFEVTKRGELSRRTRRAEPVLGDRTYERA